MENYKKIAVVGAGQMGAGITQVIASAGYSVSLQDTNPEQIKKAQNNIQSSLDKLVEKGKISQETRDQAINNMTFTNHIADLASSDLVIESIHESMPAKIKLFSELDKAIQPGATLSSNTSSISITRLAGSTSRRDKFIGIHFFNPAQLMPLVEIIPGKDTSAETLKLAKEFAISLGKTAIVANDTPGFIVNRILCPMINEAIALVAEGNQPTDIDQAIQLGASHPMGPLTLADYVGLDTLEAILKTYQEDFGDKRYAPHPLLSQYVAEGKLGKKSGEGFYDYNKPLS